MDYQPRWVDGREVGTAHRDAAKRYAAIAERLYGHEGFTVLDVGAYNGYFSLRLAEEFGASVVAADTHRGLRRSLAEAGDDRVRGVYEKLTPARVREMGPFDVVLCLSVLHHVPEWEPLLEALHDSTRVLFVETATPKETLPKAIAHSDSARITDAVAALGGEVIARTAGYKSRKLRPLRMIGSLGGGA